MDLFGHGKVRRLVIKAQRLAYADADLPRLLVTVSDVTDARKAERLKDELLRERAVLLEEIQHRVANCLQTIASMLLQSARSVPSEETKTHLRDAHNRVMSIASVQRQPASSGKLDVELRPYFTRLCQSVGASMIQDHKKQSIYMLVSRLPMPDQERQYLLCAPRWPSRSPTLSRPRPFCRRKYLNRRKCIRVSGMQFTRKLVVLLAGT
jgi:two-component system, sensor histidine kinase PdtaS